MQGRKKYLVNMLSYKYKQESMKLFPSILSKNIIPNPSKGIIENPLRTISNLCPGGKNCQNYIIICQLEKQIKTLNDTIIQLKQINEFEDARVNKMSFSELKINDSFKSEKSDKNSELCNSFRNSSVKRSNSLFDDKLNRQMHQTASCTLRTLSNDSEDKSNDEFNYIRNRIKCFTLHKDVNTNIETDNILSEKKVPKEPKVNAYKIFQTNFMKKKNLNQRLEQSDKVDEKLNRETIKNKVIFRNKIEGNSCEKNKNENNSLSTAIKILQNNEGEANNNPNKEIKIYKTTENEKSNNEKRIKINFFSGIKPLKTLKPSNKLNLISDNETQSKPKIYQNNDKIKNINIIGGKDNIISKKNIQNNINNNNILLLNEFNNYIKDYEAKSNYTNGELIYNNLYSLTLQKDKKLLENIRSLSDENIYKYSSLVNYSLKYISNITSFIHKVKYIFNNNSNNDNNTNLSNIQNGNYIYMNCNNLNDDLNKFKEVCQNSLKCEKVNIYFYDINTDCLILKEENNEKIFPKDKDLIGLSYTSCKKIRHEPDIYKSKVFSTMAIEQRLKIKIHNLLIFPIKDKEGNVHGVIELINKMKEDNNNKIYFNKNDEILLDLISCNLGDFCKYYNYIENKNKYLNYYHYILHFWNKLFLNTCSSPSLYLLLEEFSFLMKKIFDSNEIQFLLHLNHHLFDVQKNKTVELGGLIYKCLLDKKIIYSSNPLKNRNYNINIDLPVIFGNKENELSNMEQLLTFPVFYNDLSDIDNNQKKDVIMIIQIKTKKVMFLGEINGKNNDLNQENKFIIEYISFLIQKYLSDNKDIVNKFKYLV